jgi:rhamnogalacturonyl hydrolase YesR
MLGVHKGHNPKGLGLFLAAYAKLYAVEKKSEYLEKIDYLLSNLERLKSTGYSGYAWGYNFDWQSRLAYRPKYTPTIVNTSFIGHALLDTYEMTGKKQALEMALATEDFLMKDLNRKKEADVFCFSYTPIDHDYVHNANALGASLLIRLYKVNGKDKLRQTALDSLGYCFKHQQENGAWTYAQTNLQEWIDSFHTGFILESVRHFLNSAEATEWLENYNRAVRFYAENFFLSDGTPKYYHDKIYPIDIHSPAEAVFFFSGEGEEYNDLTEKILAWLINNMWHKSGYFYFRKTRYFTNKISYMRWSQAWGLRALTEYYLKNSLF